MYASFLLQCTVSWAVNTSRMSQPDMGSIFHIKNKWNNLVIGSYYVNYQHYQNLMLLSSSDTKRTMMHLFLFTNSTQRELVLICKQSIRNCNQLSLHYDLEQYEIWETTKRNLKQTFKKNKGHKYSKFVWLSLYFITFCLCPVKA